MMVVFQLISNLILKSLVWPCCVAQALLCSYTVGFIVLNLIRVDKDGKVKFDVVFGPAYKGISLGALVCAALYSDHCVDVGFAYNRKEAKDHGEGGVLVGASMASKRVLIVDASSLQGPPSGNHTNCSRR